nr:FLYWCH-type zinc finger-containing protein 1-like [Parasteatoda tepidariorum]
MDTNTFHFMPLKRGGRVLIFEEEIFNILKKKGETTYWRCSQFWKCGCTARVTLKKDMFHSRAENHNHSSSEGKIAARSFKEKLKTRAAGETGTPISRLYNEEIGKLATSAEAAANLPSYDSIKQCLYKVRHKERPNLPHSLDDLVLPQK